MRILIVIDGLKATSSLPQADAALRLGAYLLQGHLADEPPTVLVVPKRETLRSRAGAILDNALVFLGSADVRTKVRIGVPVEEVLQEAEEGQYGLILVGDSLSADRIRLRRGSVAADIAERAPCPVLVARGHTGLLRRILLCDSGGKVPPQPVPSPATTPGRASLLSRFTGQLAEMLEGDEEITVLHVMSQISAGPGVRGKQLRASAEELITEHTPEGELLAQDLQILEKPHVRAYPKVRHGLVLDEILDEARTGDYDLVVIGAHPGGGWQHLLLDDLTHDIVTHLDRPVLVVR
jgi:nucleotide-binding universal stress UspA family protein